MPATLDAPLIIERVVGFESTTENRVDRSRSIIRGVKILGLESRNTARMLGLDESTVGSGAIDKSYAYTMEALRSAAPMYENAKVYVGHSPFELDDFGRLKPIRNVSGRENDWIGVLKNVHAVEGHGLFGDLHYLQSNKFTPTLLEAATRFQTSLGFSHEALCGDFEVREGKVYVTKIDNVKMVALTGENLGTTTGLFELFRGDQTKKPQGKKTMKLRELFEAVPAITKGRATLGKVLEVAAKKRLPKKGLLREMGEDDYGASMDAVNDVDVPAPMSDEPVDQEESVRQGLLAAINAAIATADADTLRSILGALDMSDSVSELASGADTKPEPADEGSVIAEMDGDEMPPKEDDDDEAMVKESVSKRDALWSECLSILEESNVKPTAILMESMLALPTTAKRKALAKCWTPEVKLPRPASFASETSRQPNDKQSKAEPKPYEPGSLVAEFSKPIRR